MEDSTVYSAWLITWLITTSVAFHVVFHIEFHGRLQMFYTCVSSREKFSKLQRGRAQPRLHVHHTSRHRLRCKAHWAFRLPRLRRSLVLTRINPFRLRVRNLVKKPNVPNSVEISCQGVIKGAESKSGLDFGKFSTFGG